MNPEDRHVGSDEARSNFRTLLDDVQHGEAHIVLLRHGKPAAVMVPIEWYQQMRAEITAGTVAS